MIEVTHASKKYSPDKVRKRYVRWNGLSYAWCEVGEDPRYDLRQGWCSKEELPPEIMEAANANRGQAFSYVEWPL